MGYPVSLNGKNLKLNVPACNLGPLFLDPYIISRLIIEMAVKLDLPGPHPVFHMLLLILYVPDPFPERRLAPAPPVEVEGKEEYEVEAILDSLKVYCIDFFSFFLFYVFKYLQNDLLPVYYVIVNC